MKIKELEFIHPSKLINTNRLILWDEFFLKVYSLLYERLDPSKVSLSDKYAHIDFDDLKPQLHDLLVSLTEEQIKSLRGLHAPNKINPQEWEKSKELKAISVFIWFFPEFGHMILNIHLLAKSSLKTTELYLNIKIDSKNFIDAKRFIDQMNRERWTRPQSDSEQQSGVSNLGGVSEALLESAMEKLIDNTNFFKSTNQQVQSYGDFVLMCLPNNLWLSVKSNFARERLLASGYTTDILGVGFFTDKNEFTSQSKIRNFQRVGFLAMYLPDVPVSEDQIHRNTNTYEEVCENYSRQKINMPININGTPFLRKLSSLHSDIKKLIEISDISSRTTINF